MAMRKSAAVVAAWIRSSSTEPGGPKAAECDECEAEGSPASSSGELEPAAGM